MRTRFIAAALLAVAVVGPMGVDVAVAAPTPTPTVPTLAPYELPDTPFDGAVGGEDLATRGRVVVDESAGIAPVPVVPAGSFVVADLDTGDILAARDAHAPLPPASTIKTLTALVVLDSLAPTTPYLASRDDTLVEGSQVGIVAGQSYTVDQLCYGLLLASGNDAAHALGEALGGQQQAVAAMNDEARRLGAFDTHAVNTHGLDDEAQVSSAYDLALIARAGLLRDDFRRYVATPRFQFPGKPGATFEIQNQNRLLGKYAGTIGVKTGYTSNAKHTFIGAAERDGHQLIVTVMMTRGRGEAAAAQLLDWGFGAVDTAQAVGQLVTPDDVEDANSPQPQLSPHGAEGGTVAADAQIIGAHSIGETVPAWLWPAAIGAALVTAALIGFIARRRQGRGRYSASTQGPGA